MSFGGKRESIKKKKKSGKPPQNSRPGFLCVCRSSITERTHVFHPTRLFLTTIQNGGKKKKNKNKTGSSFPVEIECFTMTRPPFEFPPNWLCRSYSPSLLNVCCLITTAKVIQSFSFWKLFLVDLSPIVPIPSAFQWGPNFNPSSPSTQRARVNGIIKRVRVYTWIQQHGDHRSQRIAGHLF